MRNLVYTINEILFESILDKVICCIIQSFLMIIKMK